MDYFETFRPVVKLNSMRVILSIAITLNWSLYQLDIKNVFLYGDLQDEVYMQMPLASVQNGKVVEFAT